MPLGPAPRQGQDGRLDVLRQDAPGAGKVEREGR